ncbi:DUF2007 domain-containing protein [Exilibacterium tricleocarpae]|uniref:DUF2007 domain-containing protein n=1 Tax=Exilibacterium tricleocarpae TaxID=2591008 RepID=A0A545T0F0_9GAMM|nr:DUF2007 domain-containing protein [Exilibacterium tricleocarpae]TQV70697.1 DUF2007 domain-containing protein [Exilibacterium tricleocarpae]
MKPVYHPQNTIEAHLIRGMLAQQGIECVIQGEYLQGGLGELPMAGTLAVLVSENTFDSAREIIASYEQSLLA